MSADVVTQQRELEHQGTALVVQARALAVTDQPSFEVAAGMLRTVKTYLARVAAVLDPVIRAAHVAHKVAVDQKKILDAPALKAEGVLKASMAAYEQEIGRQRREAEAQAQQELARREAEAQAQQELARREAEAQAMAEEAALAQALAREAEGDHEGAQTVMVIPMPPAPVATFVPPVVVEAPKAEGISFRTIYRVEVDNFMALVMAVAANGLPLAVLKPDQTALDGYARSMMGAVEIPGCRMVAERVVVARVAS